MVPHALNQKVEFIESYGPKLENFNIQNFLKNNDRDFIKNLIQFIKQ